MGTTYDIDHTSSTVLDSIYEWNQDRGLIQKDFDLNLEYEMLKEELIELIVAKEQVDVADALGDLIFVAVGALGKLTKDRQKVDDILTAITAANNQKTQEVSGIGKIIKPDNFIGPEDMIQRILDV